MSNQINWDVPEQWQGDPTQVRQRPTPPFGLPAAKFVKSLMTWANAAGVVGIVISFGLIAVAAGRSIAGVPLMFDISGTALNFENGTQPVLPMVIRLGIISIAVMLGATTGVNLAKPHGEAKSYTQGAIYWAASAVAAAPITGLIVGGVLTFLINVVVVSMFPELVSLLYPDEPLRVAIY